MTDSIPPVPASDEPSTASEPLLAAEPAQTEAEVAAAPPDLAASPGYPPAAGPIGKVRGTGMCFLLMIVTLGIYSLFWYTFTHSEMKRHTGQGIGGGVAFLLAFFVGIVMPFINAGEVGGLYTRRGQQHPVSGVTGLWILLPFVGLIVWFVKTNGALNNYWRSLGAV